MRGNSKIDPTQYTCPEGVDPDTHHLRPAAGGVLRCAYCHQTREALVRTILREHQQPSPHAR